MENKVRHSVAINLIEAALERVDSRLRIYRMFESPLPNSKEEICVEADTGPGTVCGIGWIKNGVLQWDDVGGYTYTDIKDAGALIEWAEKRRSLFDTQKCKEAMIKIAREHGHKI